MSSAQLDSAVSARGSRVLAFLIDFVLLTVVTMFIWGVFTVLKLLLGAGTMLGAAAMDGSGAAAGSTASAAGSSAASLGILVVGYGLGLVQWAVIGLALGGYFVYLLKSSGQTLGMRITDVTVLSEDGSACTQSQAIKRTAVLLAPLPLMALSAVFIPLVGLFIALFLMVGWLFVEAVMLFLSSDAQRLGDRLADTLVVEA